MPTLSLINPKTKNYSNQFQAVLLIFNSDPYLFEAVSPYINFECECINWNKIFKMPFKSHHQAAITWAYGIWTDQQRMHFDCFEDALDLRPSVKVAILEALVLRWGLRS